MWEYASPFLEIYPPEIQISDAELMEKAKPALRAELDQIVEFMKDILPSSKLKTMSPITAKLFFMEQFKHYMKPRNCAQKSPPEYAQLFSKTESAKNALDYASQENTIDPLLVATLFLTEL